MPFLDPMHDPKPKRKRKLGIKINSELIEDTQGVHKYHIHATPKYEASSEGLEKTLTKIIGQGVPDTRIGHATLSIEEKERAKSSLDPRVLVWEKADKEGITSNRFAEIGTFFPTFELGKKSNDPDEKGYKSSKAFAHTGLAEKTLAMMIGDALKDDASMLWVASPRLLFIDFMGKHDIKPIGLAQGRNVFALNQNEMKALKARLEKHLDELGWSSE